MTGLAPHARLHYGVIVDRDAAPRWQHDVVRALEDGGDAELALLIRARDIASQPTTGRFSLWRLYNNGFVAHRSTSARSIATWSELAGSASQLSVSVERRGKWSQYFGPADLEVIGDARLDFILRFGLGIIRGPILDAAQYGVWSFHHDDERVVRGGPPAFWELYENLPTSGVVLQRLTERLDGGVPLARATFRSVTYSYARNRDRAFLGAAALPARVAREVREGFLDPCAIDPSASDAPIRHNPTNAEMAQFLARQTARATAARVRGVARADVWTVGIIAPPASPSGDVVLRDVEWLPELRPGGYLADPFPAVRDGRRAILVEEYDEQQARGVISALQRYGDEWALESGVIDPGVHASYPFVVTDQATLYCVPETWQASRVELWRCVDFPSRWERAGVLVDGVPVVDPTLVEYGGRWWLFGTRKDDEPDTKLLLWCAPRLMGPWEPHPLNPVKIDVRSSRPAGTPFVVDDVLYRPAQDCSTNYGAGVVINRVLELGERGLVEETAGRVVLPPGRYASGTHTISETEGCWVIDGRRYGVNRHRSGRELRARVRRLARRTPA